MTTSQKNMIMIVCLTLLYESWTELGNDVIIIIIFFAELLTVTFVQVTHTHTHTYIYIYSLYIFFYHQNTIVLRLINLTCIIFHFNR